MFIHLLIINWLILELGYIITVIFMFNPKSYKRMKKEACILLTFKCKGEVQNRWCHFGTCKHSALPKEKWKSIEAWRDIYIFIDEFMPFWGCTLNFIIAPLKTTIVVTVMIMCFSIFFWHCLLMLHLPTHLLQIG